MAYGSLGENQKVFVVAMYFSGDGAGWSERCFIIASSRSSAITAAKTIGDLRLAILPNTCQMDWMKVTEFGGSRDSSAVYTSYPQVGTWAGDSDGSTEADYSPNRIEDALVLRFETDAGEFTQRYLHGVPDVTVNQDELNRGISTASSVPAVPLVGAPTWAVAVGGYMYLLKTTTFLFRQRTSGANVVKEQSAIANISVRRIRGHKTGRPFGLQVGRARPR